jgi:hypothetical protein
MKGETTPMHKTKSNDQAAPKKAATPQGNAPESTIPGPIDPDWVNDTPNDTMYSLTMFGPDGGAEQDIELTRGEFVRMKRWVAALRGYHLTAPVSPLGLLNFKDEAARIEAELRVTQEEIEMLIDVERIADTLALNFRRRLKLGAMIESGKWQLSGAEDSIESYEGETVGTNRCGVDIHLTERETKTGTASA